MMRDLGFGKKHVLIVDDDELFLNLLSPVLETMAFASVHTSTNGRKALELVEAETSLIDVILLDVMMPELDGIEFMRELEKIQYCGHIVLMSGSDKTILKGLKQSNATLKILGTLEKPFNPCDLRKLLKSMDVPEHFCQSKHSHHITPEKIARALEQRAFMPYYQPKIDMVSSLVVGFEALARWFTEQGEPIPPDQFIPVAEQSGQICELDKLILEKTMAQLSLWKLENINLMASVNCSAITLGQVEASEDIRRLAQANDVLLNDFTMELTESVLIHEDSTAMQNILRLHLYGMKLSMDDYGTGYSGMRYLTQIPFSEIKVDQCFVTGASSDDSKISIIGSSIRLAKKLSLLSVCEGIETLEDHNLIQALGADLGQGFFYSRPLPADAFLAWVVDHNKKVSPKNNPI